MIGSCYLLEFPLHNINGLKEIPETFVAGTIQFDGVHLENTCVEHKELSLVFQVGHPRVEPLESKLMKREDMDS